MIEASIKINGAFRPDWKPRPPVVMNAMRGHIWISFSFKVAPDLFLVFTHMKRILSLSLAQGTRLSTFRLWLRLKIFMADLGNVLTKIMLKKL